MSYKDGIVCPERFGQNGKRKILWILREVNHEGELVNWDMREILQNLKTETGIELGWDKTFSSIVYVSYGIINNLKWDDIDDIKNNPDIVDILKDIAYINVRKESGGERVDFSKLEADYKINKESLFKDINYINPEIIIYGGTYYLFKEDINFFIENKNILHLDEYHPQQTTITREAYFNNILDKINQ